VRGLVMVAAGRVALVREFTVRSATCCVRLRRSDRDISEGWRCVVPTAMRARCEECGGRVCARDS